MVSLSANARRRASASNTSVPAPNALGIGFCRKIGAWDGRGV